MYNIFNSCQEPLLGIEPGHDSTVKEELYQCAMHPYFNESGPGLKLDPAPFGFGLDTLKPLSTFRAFFITS